MQVKLTSNFRQISKEMGAALVPAVLKACYLVHGEWMRILAGTRSGKRYRVPGTGTKKRGSGTYYTASRPGEAPAQRLGDLRRSLRVQPRTSSKRVQARVGSPLEYAVYLEYGTRYMDPREHLGKAIRNTKRMVTKIIKEAVS